MKKPKQYATTATEDGGQQYVRGKKPADKLTTAQAVDDAYRRAPGTKSPAVMENLGRARVYATDPTANSKKLAKVYGDTGRSMATAMNEPARYRGDKTRR